MNCREVELRLEALLAGTLPAAEVSLCADHLEGCALCRDLVALARCSDAAAAGYAGPLPDLAPAVIARNGNGGGGDGKAGGACGRAHELLAAGLDDPLADIDRLLLHGHLATCDGCRALHGALLELARDLPRLAEVQPDPSFVAAVLRRTLPFEVQIRRWWDALWPQLWHRPRFASEVAYVGLVVLVLVFATPGSPLAAVPSGALAIAQEPPLPHLELPAVAAEWGAELRARKDNAVEIVIEVRTRMGTFWDEAASLLETRDATPSSEP